MSVYRVVQTGPKTKLGGAKNGFVRVAYHVGIEEKENIEPRIPAIWQKSMALTRRNQFR
jgi:hypothetical protein